MCALGVVAQINNLAGDADRDEHPNGLPRPRSLVAGTKPLLTRGLLPRSVAR
jgi:hypothetical protein